MTEPAKTNDFIPIAEAARLAPGKPTPMSVWRWIKFGAKNRYTGHRIYLQHIRVGQRILTRSAWVLKFMTDLAAQPKTTPKITPDERRALKTKEALDHV